MRARSLQRGLLVASAMALMGCPPEPGDEIELSPGQLVLQGLSESTFNPTGADVRFNLQGATLSGKAGHVTVFHNGDVLPANAAHVTPNGILLPALLQEGNNQIEVYTDDDEGRLASTVVELWAGSSFLTVLVTDEGGAPSDAIVSAKVGEAPKLNVVEPTVGGTVTLDNVPVHTVLLAASSMDGELFGTAGAMGGSDVSLTLYAMHPASPIDNNDFANGETGGWDIGGAPVTLIPHDEGGPTPKAENFDLVLSTAGEGVQHISRTFTAKAGSNSVSVRYRFITSEVPGGYFGSQYNDYFSVVVRAASGAQVSESNSMNGLGLASFDAAGATSWRETTLLLGKKQDTVQVDVSVANVADGLFDSQVVVDMVAERKLAITAASLRDIDGTALGFLSASPHTYFGGNTRVHGTMTIEGDKDATINAVELQLLQGGAVLATGNLAVSARTSLLQRLGDDEKVEITSPELLFEIPSTELALLDSATNTTVALRARVTSAAGDEVTFDLGAVPVLALYDGNVRYGGRDAELGGDDWLIPSVASVLSDAGITVGDISNMNGGPFAPHASHRQGVDADGHFEGYNNRDADVAATMLGHLNATYGPRIQVVFVTYAQEPDDPFWTAIRNVELDDGRRARDVIRPLGGHTTHFHWRIQP